MDHVVGPGGVESEVDVDHGLSTNGLEPATHDLVNKANGVIPTLQNAQPPEPMPWPEHNQQASLSALEGFAKSVTVPAKVHRAVVDLISQGNTLQEWIAERREGHRMMEHFLQQGNVCKADADANGKQNTLSECMQVNPDQAWHVNRRITSERMWEFDQKVKDTTKALEEALAEAEQVEAPMAARAYASLKGQSMPGSALSACAFSPNLPRSNGSPNTRRRQRARFSRGQFNSFL